MLPTRLALPAGRWSLQHGPIDLLIGADGDPEAVHAAHAAAWQRFGTVLPELVAELALLRQPVGGACPLQGVVARRMWAACHPHRAAFITPMAAVAGAVAEEILAAYQRDGITRAWINNGGDIALHLAPGQSVQVGVCADIARHASRTESDTESGTGSALDGRFELQHASPVRGVATSGWRGRSFSLGIADSVTVLAATAAVADAAATMIANAVDIDDARIVRRPASSLKDNSDLGDIAVTVDVLPLPAALVAEALRLGVQRAQQLRERGLIHTALLVCQGQGVVVADANQATQRALAAATITSATPTRAAHGSVFA